jgi:hypothetical protein
MKPSGLPGQDGEMKGLPLGQLLTMFAVVIVIFGLFKSGFIGGPRS